MAITINGSGTISGITAGGLPDGVITADDLAAGVGGKVLQVVQGTPLSADASTTTSGSWVDTGAAVAITPSSSSSKVLIIATGNATNTNSGAYTNGVFTIERDIASGGYSDILLATSVDGGGNVYGGATLNHYNGATELAAAINMSLLDSPSTTSLCTYRISMRIVAGYGTTKLNKGSRLIAMEIAG
jgi:hypothetical protein